MPAPAFFTFWSINGPLDRTRLRRQLAAFKTAGLHGVVFHPRFYPGRPPYLSDDYLAHVADTILHARALGLRFWLYDENGWPSGTGDGKVLAQYPDSGAMRLDLTSDPQPETLGAFHVDATNRLVPAGTPGARTWHLTPRRVHYVDSLDPAVLGHFIELIHERYRAGLPAEAFEAIEAIFFDEPESGMIKDPFPNVAGIPWSPALVPLLRQRMGHDFALKLPLAFAAGEGAAEVRVAFWEAVTDALIAGFFAPYHDWCRRHGKLFLGHVKGEEHPLFQLPLVGSCHRAFRHFSRPGIDALERFPSLDFFPRQAAAVARQFGDGRSLVECFGGAGWGASPADLERYLLWLGRNGITDFVFHLSQYRLDTAAITDWPPSEPLHLSWREAFPAVLDRVARTLAAEPPTTPDTLVVAPYRGLMARYEPWELGLTNQHNASTGPDTPATRANRAFLARLDALTAAGVAWDVTDERTLETDGRRLPDGSVQLGQASYARLIVDEAAELRGEWRGARDEPGGPPPPKRVEDNALHPRSGRVLPLAWTLAGTPDNAWLLAVERTAPGEFAATFDTTQLPAGMALHFADDVAAAALDDARLALTPGDDGTSAMLTALAAGEHTLTFRTAREVPGWPFVWLCGGFTVRSHTRFASGPNGTLRTDGPLFADRAPIDPAGELAAGGLPFLHATLAAEAVFSLDAPATTLRFAGIAGDALHVAVDGTDAGWSWGPDWALALPHSLATGLHRLRVGLVPSTFNHFGPHHYYNGDWHVVSPGQVVGERNFADALDAPAHTHVAAWHFKPLHLPTALAVVP